MRVFFKISSGLIDTVRADLARPHKFAAERVGFLSCQVGQLTLGGTIILAHTYHPLGDSDYLPDTTVGAMMGSGAIRKAMQLALISQISMFHIHMHNHHGIPRFSHVDITEYGKFVPQFWHVRPEMPHGALVLSWDAVAGRCWHPNYRQPVTISRITIVGAPLLNIPKWRNGR
jgi:hypothetical protein